MKGTDEEIFFLSWRCWIVKFEHQFYQQKDIIEYKPETEEKNLSRRNSLLRKFDKL